MKNLFITSFAMENGRCYYTKAIIQERDYKLKYIGVNNMKKNHFSYTIL